MTLFDVEQFETEVAARLSIVIRQTGAVPEVSLVSCRARRQVRCRHRSSDGSGGGSASAALAGPCARSSVTT